jgi:hypothetical protein
MKKLHLFLATSSLLASTLLAGDPSAHAPRFEDKKLWPNLTGKEYFTSEKWPAATVLVWAHPGESGGGKTRATKHDPFDPANWIDEASGKPATSLPDGGVDVVLPPASEPYVVSWSVKGKEHNPMDVRHLTVGRNAGWSSSGLNIYGNLWVMEGAKFSNHGATTPKGSRHTFLRDDRPHEESKGENGEKVGDAMKDRPFLSQYLKFEKENASCEMLGKFSFTDEFNISKGMLIIGPGSIVMPGRNATPWVGEGASLVLLSGSRFGKWLNQISQVDMILSGTLQGGLPERPLTQDALFGISYQNTIGAKFYDNGLLEVPRNRSLETRITPLLITDTAVIRSISAQPDAQLVIGWLGLDAKNWHAATQEMRRIDAASKDYLVKQLDTLPKKVTAAVAKGAKFENVKLNHFAKGGILVLDGGLPAGWKNVTVGPESEGSLTELVRKVSSIDFKTGSYEE